MTMASVTIRTKTSRAKPLIATLKINQTYAGWLEGLPNAEDNARILSRIVADASKELSFQHQPVLIEPLYKPIKVPASLQKIYSEDRYWLPSYYVYALLDGPPLDNNYCGALAAIILLVDDISLPIPSILETACCELFWEEIAHNYDI